MLWLFNIILGSRRVDSPRHWPSLLLNYVSSKAFCFGMLLQDRWDFIPATSSAETQALSLPLLSHCLKGKQEMFSDRLRFTSSQELSFRQTLPITSVYRMVNFHDTFPVQELFSNILHVGRNSAYELSEDYQEV